MNLEIKSREFNDYDVVPVAEYNEHIDKFYLDFNTPEYEKVEFATMRMTRSEAYELLNVISQAILGMDVIETKTRKVIVDEP